MPKKIKRVTLSRKIIFFLIVASIVFSALTFVTINQVTSDFTSSNAYLLMLLFVADSALIFTFIILIARKLFSIWIKRKQQFQGSRLQIRILLMFSVLYVIPAILIAIFSAMFFRYVIDSWFDRRVSTVLDESVVVAESYLKEHHEVIKIRAKAMAMEIDNNVLKYDLMSNKKLFTDIVSSLADLNSLSEAVIFYNHKPIVRSRFGISLSYEVFPEQIYIEAAKGESIIIKNTSNKLRTMVMLHSLPNSYLVVGKYIDSNVVNHIKKSQGAATQYKNLKAQIVNTQLQFAAIFLVVSVLILLVAIYIGISFSGTIIKPIERLVSATRKVQLGDFSAKVEEGPENDELANLSRAFNLMTARISEQQTKLVQAYNEIDDKIKFNEAVLSGVSTGIIAIASDGKIKLINDSGAKLLSVGKKTIIGLSITDLIPDCAELINKIKEGGKKYASSEIKLKIGHKLLTLFLKIAAEVTSNKIVGYVITFDDMTELLQVQRHAAWSDVARRIAHEVKNPLTPIRLGAERLNKKFSHEVDDPSTFTKYTSTIIRHVKDISRIIEEFSYFARMPAPVMEEINLSKVVEDLAFSRECVTTSIKYELDVHTGVVIMFDQTQLNQMLINLLKNAEESIESSAIFEKGEGRIKISVHKDKKYAKLSIIDNGKGFDSSTIDKVIEPYFTTKEKGTGLGLAIVKKIVDDHNGKIIMINDQDNCAVVTVFLPLYLKRD